MLDNEIAEYITEIKEAKEIFKDLDINYPLTKAEFKEHKNKYPKVFDLFISNYTEMLNYNTYGVYVQWWHTDCKDATYAKRSSHLVDFLNSMVTTPITKEDFCKIGNNIKVKEHEKYFNKQTIKMLKEARPKKPRKVNGINWNTRKYTFNKMDLTLLKSSIKDATISTVAITSMLSQHQKINNSYNIDEYLDVMVPRLKSHTKTLLKILNDYNAIGSKYTPISMMKLRQYKALVQPSEVVDSFSTDIPIIPAVVLDLEPGSYDVDRYYIRLKFALQVLHNTNSPVFSTLLNNTPSKVKEDLRITLETEIKLNQNLLKDLK